MKTLSGMVAETLARWEAADLQAARYYKYNPNPKRWRVNGEDVTEKEIARLKRTGVWDKV